jgi:signal transduction histidine kinase
MSVAREIRTARLARIIHVASLVLLAVIAFLALAPLGANRGEPPDPFFGVLTIVVVAGYTTLGRMIVTRAGNLIGWVFLSMGAAVAIGLPAEGYVEASYGQPYVASLPGTAVAGWLANLLPALLALALPMLFLLFPTGKPPTLRWRWVAWLWLVGASLSLVWLAFRPGELLSERDRFSIQNPFGVEALRMLRPLFADLGVACVLIAAVGAVVSLVFRFRRAAREERQQVKWLMFVGIAAVTILALMFILEAVFAPATEPANGPADLLWLPLVLVLLVGPPAATGIAVFRYRLYDIDVVIRKTVVFGVLAAFITLVYVAIVQGLGSLFDDTLFLRIVATALIAVAFQPVRDRANRLANRLVYGERATPYEVLARFGERVGETYASDDVLPRVARVIAEGTSAQRADVWLRLGDALTLAASWPPAGIEASHAIRGDELPPIDADRVAPVRHQGELLGAIAVSKPASEPLSPGEAELLDRLADQAGLILANARLTADLEARLRQIGEQAADLRASRQRIVAAQDEERRRLERNIHDGAQQHLVALAVKLRLAKVTFEKDPERGRRMVEEIRGEVDAALDTLRSLALGIYPPLLEEQGIAAALAAQYTRGGLPVRMETDGIGRYPIELEAAVYFCTLEALQNAAKYAHASTIMISFHEREGVLEFRVADDGVGFDAASEPGGTGIQGIRDRIAVFGGDARIESTPGAGTVLTGRVPVQELVRS